MRRVIAGLAMLVLAAPLWSQEPTGGETAEHTVRRGDTLWELAGQYLDDPYLWPVLYQANTARVSDPDLILPGQVLLIPAAAVPTAPTARISIRTAAQEPDPLGDPVDPARRTQQAAPPSETAPAAQPAQEQRTGLAFDRAGPRRDGPQDPNRTVFYRPPPPSRTQDRPTVLSEPGIERLAVKPGEYASAAWVADPAELVVVGTFMRARRTNPETWRGPVSAHPNDELFIAYGDGARPEPGARLVIVDVGRPVRTGGEGQRIIDPRGIARVTALGAEAIEASLVAQYGPVLPGQIVLADAPMPDQPTGDAEPVPDGFDLEGRIVAFASDRPLHGRADLAFVDLGRVDGVRLGDVFLAYVPARESDVEVVEERTLPPEPIAELRVVRVTEDAATVTVDRLTLPRLREELPVRRIRRMP